MWNKNTAYTIVDIASSGINQVMWNLKFENKKLKKMVCDWKKGLLTIIYDKLCPKH